MEQQFASGRRRRATDTPAPVAGGIRWVAAGRQGTTSARVCVCVQRARVEPRISVTSPSACRRRPPAELSASDRPAGRAASASLQAPPAAPRTNLSVSRRGCTGRRSRPAAQTLRDSTSSSSRAAFFWQLLRFSSSSSLRCVSPCWM